MQTRISSLFAAALAGILLLGMTAMTNAADPTGTWVSSTPGRNGGAPRETTFKLKLDGDKVTGAIVNPGRQGGAPTETAIEKGKFANDEVSFEVTREFNGNKRTSKYSGKVTADTIKGKIEFEGQNGTQSRDWEAKKKEAK